MEEGEGDLADFSVVPKDIKCFQHSLLLPCQINTCDPILFYSFVCLPLVVVHTCACRGEIREPTTETIIM